MDQGQPGGESRNLCCVTSRGVLRLRFDLPVRCAICYHGREIVYTRSEIYSSMSTKSGRRLTQTYLMAWLWTLESPVLTQDSGLLTSTQVNWVTRAAAAWEDGRRDARQTHGTWGPPCVCVKETGRRGNIGARHWRGPPAC